MFKRFFAESRYTPVFILAAFSILISFLTRIAVLIVFGKDMQPSVAFIPGFAIGFMYDLVIALFIVIPFVLQIAFTNEFIYTKKGMLISIVLFLSLLIILFFTSIFPRDYNKDLYKAVEIFVSLRFVIYLFMCTRSQPARYVWRSRVLQCWIFLAFFLLIFNAVSELIFWQEFSGRYNFIAVDYLVYTNEVIGNIEESYPVFIIITAVFVAAVAFFLPFRKKIYRSSTAYLPAFKKVYIGICLLILPFVLSTIIRPGWVSFSSNNYANELSGNGIYQFAQAFKNNELDFYKFYKTVGDSSAFDIVKKELSINNNTGENFSIERVVNASSAERKMNVVLISVESLSASFMKSFGNDQNLTPFLDSLSNHSLFFTNTYASGTRTVRGLEALSLSIPPTPGQSIVKRPNNEHLFSLGSVFKSKGYTTQFIYGGYGYFDNMKYFFSNNGYEVIDRTALKSSEIHYSNIWGVADEDLFSLSLKTIDANYKSGKPFFTQVMTVSNHRPFTYPDGRIDIPSSSQSREGGVKYTDYAIGQFIKQAASKPWFDNTVFVIVADHCARSTGKAYLPVTGYHIPLLIYAPKYLQPQKINTLTSQIDIPPTILGLLGISYKSKFFGNNALDTNVSKRRAFISTYQGLGLIVNNKLVVQSPVKKLAMFYPDFHTGEAEKISVIDSLAKEAISFYQVATWLVKNKRYGAVDQPFNKINLERNKN